MEEKLQKRRSPRPCWEVPRSAPLLLTVLTAVAGWAHPARSHAGVVLGGAATAPAAARPGSAPAPAPRHRGHGGGARELRRGRTDGAAQETRTLRPAKCCWLGRGGRSPAAGPACVGMGRSAGGRPRAGAGQGPAGALRPRRAGAAGQVRAQGRRSPPAAPGRLRLGWAPAERGARSARDRVCA